MISGVVIKAPETRFTPAGIPLVRFAIEHESQQAEAGMQRQTQCRIRGVASGTVLQARAETLQVGDRVRLSGFLSRGGYRQSEWALVLHVDSIDKFSD